MIETQTNLNKSEGYLIGDKGILFHTYYDKYHRLEPIAFIAQNKNPTLRPQKKQPTAIEDTPDEDIPDFNVNLDVKIKSSDTDKP